MPENKLVSHAATVLFVKNAKNAAEFYRDKLGFTITFEWGDPVRYVVTNRDEAVYLHFSNAEENAHQDSRTAAVYIFCHDVDEVHTELLEKGVEISNPIDDREYGMRDFDVIDPDGNMVTFATHTSRV